MLAEHADKGLFFSLIHSDYTLNNTDVQIAQRRGQVLAAYEELQGIAGHLNKLGAEGMSGDESDHLDGHRRYVVSKLNWRSDEVTEVLRALDALVLVSHWTSDGRPRPGKFPHVRLHSDKVEERDPVRNLPRNFYQTEWLDTLDKYERRELNMSEPVKLSLPPGLLRYVTSFPVDVGHLSSNMSSFGTV